MRQFSAFSLLIPRMISSRELSIRQKRAAAGSVFLRAGKPVLIRFTMKRIFTSEYGRQIRSACGKPGSGCAGIVSRQGGERIDDGANNTTAVCSLWHGSRQ